MTLSSVETKYVAATTVACQTIWMRRIISELQDEQNEPTPILCDNKSAIALSRNHVFHKRSKHIDIRYHFFQELINENEISVEFYRSENQFADLFTKPLGKYLFEVHRENIGVHATSPPYRHKIINHEKPF